MSRALSKRVRKLEAQHSRKKGCHVVVGDDEAAERQLAALKASGEYQDGDQILRLPWLEEAALKKHGRHT